MTKGSFLGIGALAGFVAGYFLAEPLRGGLVNALQPLLRNPAALIASAIALLVGLLGFVANWRQATVAKRSADAAKVSADAARKTAEYGGTRALAHLRIEWLNSLRDTLSEYHSILITGVEDDEEADGEAKAKAKERAETDRRKLSFLGTKLDLLLNQQKKYQKALWQVSDDILRKTEVKPLAEKELDEADKLLVAAAQKVLNFHWQKIQAEMLGQPQLTEPPAQGA